METDKAQVVVIGGGATGTGILRDLALRGIPAILVEQGDLAHGTSSRFHGLLHSGARYAVKDKEAARECIEENMILRRIAPNCVELTGGLFVQLPEDDPQYADQWITACTEAGISCAEADVQELIKKNPVLSPNVTRAFKVPDCAVDGFRILWGNVNSARRYGARVLTYHRVSAIHQSNGRVTGVELINQLNGQKRSIECEMVINAAGPWGGEVAAMAGLEVNVIKDKGTLVAYNHRLMNMVVNRLRPPGDGDIFVPHGTITILGTTSTTVDDPGCTKPGRDEVLALIKIGQEMVPELESYRLIRAFAGVRPLYQAGNATGGRSVTRNFALLDHQQRDGLAGMVSIVGGKFTTFRLMAEKTVDLVAGKLGVNAPCRTAREPLMAPVSEELLERGKRVFGVPGARKAAERLGDSFAQVVEQVEKNPDKGRILCECEVVSLAEIEHAAHSGDSFTLGDIRRKTRMGMGTCQGTFCSYRTLGALSGYPQFAGNHREYLTKFLQKRWKGMRPVLWGQQLREAQLSTGIYCTLFAMERMR
ncbi:glycerol-3-phosphate dehydrogenase, anaerobic, A subunit [Desulfotomaculum nigrificans CO-1-SRB]|uniref:Glycerol-3-phosphate dehydrogenase, anaerobic, A subunit n=1 Tax=Desulfotomaculum nigrificans (strain DSM 14880 / VKM B-2319 / CO-1-SRB) TaxID=868595 RepID=F6B4K1_DESCC|nr:anaerobic glycerol-3-phosphate dehydrogenase subunit GlpA [Desulfotomaculum nigrificans]AEF93024.1 glycerol-3-phosphate dehydrogenase, anaerobic, A subunit [Desulfotomaculum nigrificans CO-1-SRB]